MGGDQRTGRPAAWLGRQHGSPFVEGGHGDQATTYLSSLGGTLEARRQRPRQIPTSPGHGAMRGDQGQFRDPWRRPGPVHATALVGCCLTVNGEPGQRMKEPDLAIRLYQPGQGRRRHRLHAHAEPTDRMSHPHRVQDGLGRGDQQHPPRLHRERLQLPAEPFLDRSRHNQSARQPEPAGQLLGCQLGCHLQQHQRSASRLGHDPVANLLVERAADDRLQQRPRLLIGQALDRERGEAFHVLVVTALANGENNGDGLFPEAPGGELESLGRGPVKPLRLVHDADERSLPAYFAEQPQHAQADQEEIRGTPAAQAQGHAERLALWPGKLVEAIEQRYAQLVQPGEGELRLGLPARGPRHPTSGRTPQKVLEQGGLAGTSGAPQYQHLALPGASTGHQPVQDLTLAAPAPQGPLDHLTVKLRWRRGRYQRVHLSLSLPKVLLLLGRTWIIASPASDANGASSISPQGQPRPSHRAVPGVALGFPYCFLADSPARWVCAGVRLGGR